MRLMPSTFVQQNKMIQKGAIVREARSREVKYQSKLAGTAQILL
jgi:hypothetical protein